MIRRQRIINIITIPNDIPIIKYSIFIITDDDDDDDSIEMNC
jgi:hypothetical protein